MDRLMSTCCFFAFISFFGKKNSTRSILLDELSAVLAVRILLRLSPLNRGWDIWRRRVGWGCCGCMENAGVLFSFHAFFCFNLHFFGIIQGPNYNACAEDVFSVFFRMLFFFPIDVLVLDSLWARHRRSWGEGGDVVSTRPKTKNGRRQNKIWQKQRDEMIHMLSCLAIWIFKVARQKMWTTRVTSHPPGCLGPRVERQLQVIFTNSIFIGVTVQLESQEAISSWECDRWDQKRKDKENRNGKPLQTIQTHLQSTWCLPVLAQKKLPHNTSGS